jgi:hypothetical protein
MGSRSRSSLLQLSGYKRPPRHSQNRRLFACADNPIVLEEGEPNASENEADYGSLRAESAEPDRGLFSNPEAARDSRTSVSPSNPEGCHDIERNDFTETAQRLRLAEQDASTSDSMRPYSPSSRPSSDPSHGCIDAKDHSTDRARSEAVISHSARPRNQSPRRSRSSPLNQLSEEDHLHTDQNAADEHEPVHPALDTDTFDKEDRRQQQQQQQQEEEERRRRTRR